jgi:hypothetical protein
MAEFSIKERTLSYKEAMRILDKVKDGVPYPIKIIRMALELTGDLQQT